MTVTVREGQLKQFFDQMDRYHSLYNDYLASAREAFDHANMDRYHSDLDSADHFEDKYIGMRRAAELLFSTFTNAELREIAKGE